MHPLCLYSVGGGLVMWPCLAAREAGKVVSDLADWPCAQPQLENYVKRGFW